MTDIIKGKITSSPVFVFLFARIKDVCRKSEGSDHRAVNRGWDSGLNAVEQKAEEEENQTLDTEVSFLKLEKKCKPSDFIWLTTRVSTHFMIMEVIKIEKW